MPRDLKTLTLKEAQQIILHILSEASKDGGLPVAIAVAGSDGRLIAFAAMDGVMPTSIQIAQDKAHTAIMGACDTIVWEEQEKEEGLDGRNFLDPKFCCFGGGVTFEIYLGKEKKEKFIIGGIGVSGRKSEEDHTLAVKARIEFIAPLDG